MASPVPVFSQEALKKIELPLIEVSVDVAPLLKLGNLESSDAMVAALQKNDEPKVLVLDIVSPKFAKDYPNAKPIAIENAPDDEALAASYAQIYREAMSQGALGTLIPPYTVALGKLKNGKVPLILLAKNAPRKTILHEYLHYLIWEARHKRSPQFFANDGKVDHANVWKNLEMEEFASAANKQVDAYRRAESRADREKIWFKIMTPLLEVQKIQLGSLAQSHGEELEVSRFLVENRKVLHLTQDDISTELRYCAVNLRRWDEDLTVFAQQQTVRFLLQDLPTDVELRPKAEALRDQLEKITSDSSRKLDLIGSWYNAQFK